jgi:hypothetical protein
MRGGHDVKPVYPICKTSQCAAIDLCLRTANFCKKHWFKITLNGTLSRKKVCEIIALHYSLGPN